jgi:hypothetical protein
VEQWHNIKKTKFNRRKNDIYLGDKERGGENEKQRKEKKRQRILINVQDREKRKKKNKNDTYVVGKGN